MNHLINKIFRSISSVEKHNTQQLYNSVTNVLRTYTSDQLNDVVNKHISDNFELNKLKIITNGNSSYYKYNIYNSKDFDIYDIKWEKNCQSKIHDHPKFGCVVYVYNHGILTEHNYIASKNGIIFDKVKQLKSSDIGHKIGNKHLHKIYCDRYAESLHIYMPGNFVTKYYK